MSIDPARRSALLGLKLGALVRDHAGEGSLVPGTFVGGAALMRDGDAWVLADERPERSLGPALAWQRQQVTASKNERGTPGDGSRGSTLHLLADAGPAPGVLARRAELFAVPIEVLSVDGRTLSPAVASPLPMAPLLDPELAALAPRMLEGGAEPVVEHGVLAGEVAGLEVCRAGRDPDTGVVRLEVGVGAADREMFGVLHGDVPDVAALREVVAIVGRYRAIGAEPHALNRLGAERRLRWRLEQEPSLVGARWLRPGQPPVARRNLKDPVPCVAVGEDQDGRPMIVVCSVGVDLDLVPFAAEARLALRGAGLGGLALGGAGLLGANPRGRDATGSESGRSDGLTEPRLLLAVPERDAVTVTRALAGLLRFPAEVWPIPPTALEL